MPIDDTDLTTSYSSQDYLDVATKNDIWVSETGIGQYVVHQFKDFVDTAVSATLNWQGKSSLAPASSPIVLQIYNRVTLLWNTVDSNNLVAADTDFDMVVSVPSLTSYKSATNIIACRVYQLGL